PAVRPLVGPCARPSAARLRSRPGSGPAAVAGACDSDRRQVADEPGGRPPVRPTHQLHRRWDKYEPHDRGVDEDSSSEAETEELYVTLFAEDEGAEDADHDRRCGRDHTSGRGEAVRDRAGVVAGAVVFLSYAREEEDLVVHREPDDSVEQHHWHLGLDRPLPPLS